MRTLHSTFAGWIKLKKC